MVWTLGREIQWTFEVRPSGILRDKTERGGFASFVSILLSVRLCDDCDAVYNNRERGSSGRCLYSAACFLCV